MPDDGPGYQKKCPACGRLNTRLPFYAFLGPTFWSLCDSCFADLDNGRQVMTVRPAGSHRFEIDCWHCKQVNQRYTGWRKILNPRWPSDCTLCGVGLATPDVLRSLEKESVWRKGHSGVMWLMIYALHIFIGVGAFVIGGAIVALFIGKFPEMTERPFIGWSLMILGAISGVLSAERSRRRGTLVSNRRS